MTPLSIQNNAVFEADLRIYAKAWAKPGGIRAGTSVFRRLERQAKGFVQWEASPLRSDLGGGLCMRPIHSAWLAKVCTL